MYVSIRKALPLDNIRASCKSYGSFVLLESSPKKKVSQLQKPATVHWLSLQYTSYCRLQLIAATHSLLKDYECWCCAGQRPMCVKKATDRPTERYKIVLNFIYCKMNRTEQSDQQTKSKQFIRCVLRQFKLSTLKHGPLQRKPEAKHKQLKWNVWEVWRVRQEWQN